MLQEDLALNKYFKGKLMRYNRFREKKLKMKDIFDTYCNISLNLYELDNNMAYCYGDFGGYDSPTARPIFIVSDNDEDYNHYYLRFLETALEKDSFSLFLKFITYDRCYKYVLSLIKSCECLKVTKEADNTLYIKLPAKPSYEELEDIKDTFDEVCEVIDSYTKQLY